MPIYVYRCEACGAELEVLQKVSDAPLKDCPECDAGRLRKQITAAGFQLKGSGWYETDFKTKKPKKTDKKETSASEKPKKSEAKASKASTSAGESS